MFLITNWAGEQPVVYLVYPEYVSGNQIEYTWPKGYPLGASVLADFNYTLNTDSSCSNVYSGEEITDDVTFWSERKVITFDTKGGSEKAPLNLVSKTHNLTHFLPIVWK